jgi:hypothetical protein
MLNLFVRYEEKATLLPWRLFCFWRTCYCSRPRCYGVRADACVPAVTRFLAVAAMPDVVARACYSAGVPSDVAEPAVVGLQIGRF